MDLTNAEDKTDYDPIEEEEDRFNENEQPGLNKGTSEFKVSNHLLKQVRLLFENRMILILTIY